MEQIRRADRQAASIRWLALAVAALMLVDSCDWVAIGVGMALVAGYNGVLLYAAASPERYAAWGRRISAAVVCADILTITLAIGLSRPPAVSLYLLYALAIVGVGFVTAHPRSIAIATGGGIAGNLTAAWMAGMAGDMRHLLPSSAVLLAAALLAGSLHVLKQRDDAMQRRERKLSTLLEFGTRFTSGEDAARVMEQTLRGAIRDTDSTAGYIMLLQPGGEELATEVAVSVGEERPIPATVRVGEGVEGYVAETGKPLLLSRADDGERDASGQPRDARTPMPSAQHATLCIPMIESGQKRAEVLGVFTLANHRPGSRYVDEDVDLARTLAGLATMALVNSRLYQNLRESFLRSLQVLARTLDAKDAYTQGHSNRVSELCVMIARKLRVDPDAIEDLRNGALLHDVGKIGVPDQVLRKPGRLTDAEFEVMRQHPVIGYEICKPLGLGDGILMLIRNHHEKLDGTGYPDGLRGGELPLPLRIICVADAFDAMSSSRPYRKVMDAAVRNEQLNRFAGTQFDPVVVETLKALLNAGELDDLYRDHWAPQREIAPSESPLLRAA